MHHFSSKKIVHEYQRVIEQFRNTDDKPGRITLFEWDIEYISLSTIVAFLDQILLRRINDFYSDNDQPLILDCGANIGYTILNYKRQFPGAKIIAFEPDPQFVPILRRNLKRNGVRDVKIVDAAVWTKDGTAAWLVEGIDGSKIIDRSKNFQNTVTVRTIDLVKYLDQKIDLLKIDIEGAEFDVIPHIQNHLSKVKNIVVEVHITNQSKYPSLTKIIHSLIDAGFKISINSYGPWRDLIRQHIPRPIHSEQYLILSGWRVKHPDVAEEETFLPYFNIAQFAELQQSVIRLRQLKTIKIQKTLLSQSLFEIITGKSKWQSKQLKGPFRRERGLCWIFRFPKPRPLGDSSEFPRISTVLLYENGCLLGPAHSIHADIRKKGNGSYSYWKSKLYFSTSDGSDPNVNGKTYMAIWRQEPASVPKRPL